MSYSMRKRKNSYVIVEKNTNTVIELHTDKDETRVICRKLNLGGGFDGWTPDFFAIAFPMRAGPL